MRTEREREKERIPRSIKYLVEYMYNLIYVYRLNFICFDLFSPSKIKERDVEKKACDNLWQSVENSSNVENFANKALLDAPHSVPSSVESQRFKCVEQHNETISTWAELSLALPVRARGRSG